MKSRPSGSLCLCSNKIESYPSSFYLCSKKIVLKNKPVIFITNDDGIEAPGIQALVGKMREFGEIVVVAPAKAMSGVGHAITMREPILVEEYFGYEGIKAFQVHGTPVDCVKYALAEVFDTFPDLLVSGINHGSNATVNLLYSGTMAAAKEGAIAGITSVGFSSTNYNEDGDLSAPLVVVDHVIKMILNNKMPENLLLNVNIPALNADELKGVKITRQAKSRWIETFKTNDSDESGKSFWLTGEFSCNDRLPDTDQYALDNGYASVQPVQLDMTNYKLIQELKKYEI
jgi:5'-nucleotidase